MYCLKHLEEFESIPASLDDPIFEQVFERAELAKLTPEERERYDESLKVYWDLNNVIDTARQEGEQKGRIEGKVESLQEAICDAIEVKFGKVAEEMKASIMTLQDETKLKELLRAVILARSLEEIEGRVASG